MLRSALPKNLTPQEPYKLRDLQTFAFHQVLFYARHGHSCQTVVAPPGAGKSLIGNTFSGHLLTKGVTGLNGDRREYDGIVIVVPTKQIMPSFTSISQVDVPGGVLRNPHYPYLLDFDHLWAQEIDVEASPESCSREDIKQFFDPEEGGGILIMSSNMLLKHWDAFPKDLTRYHLHLDEAHHAPKEGTETGRRRNEWLERGGTVLQTSATPWHTKTGKRIYTDDEPVTTISLSDLRHERQVPGNIGFNRIMLKYTAETIKDMLMEVEPSQELLEAYQDIAAYWESQGRPITVVRPPDTRHNQVLKEVFEAIGARVLDATGDDFDRTELIKERNCTTYKGLQYDIILACRRFDEGTDHSAVSNVYYIGAPGSVRLVIQLLGRALRLKKRPDYPKEWADKACFTAFIPQGAAAAEKYLEVHKQDATMLAAYLADVNVGDHIISNFSSRLRQSFVFGTPGTGGDTGTKAARNDAIQRLFGDDISRSEATSVFDEICAKVSRKTEQPLTALEAKKVAKGILDIQDPAMRSRVIGICVDTWRQSDVPETIKAGEDLEREIRKIIEQVKAGSFPANEVLRATLAVGDALREVMKDFNHLHRMSINMGRLEILSQFTGLDYETIATKLRWLCMSTPTRGEVVRAISTHIRRERKYPTRRSGKTDRDGIPGYSYAKIQANWEAFGLDAADSLEEYGRSLL